MADTWASDAERFNKFHAPAGSAAGGQFAAASGGSGKGAKGKDTRPAPTNQHPVGQGETGRRVSDLQSRLNALGFKPALKVDGIFGPKTLAAVRAFQRSHGLKVDGLVGPKTTAALRARPPAVQHAPAPAPVKKTTPTAAAAAAGTARRGLAHEPLGRPGGPGLWHDKNRQLPAYIQHIANDLRTERGMPESEAIATAVSTCKKWAAGGKDVHPDTRAKAAAAIAEWERLKAQTKVRRSAVAGTPQYDPDGLDESWEGDHSDLPDLTGLGVPHMEAAERDLGMAPAGDGQASRAMPKLGTGARFAKLKSSLAAKGASDPGALAAYIGRRKFGKAKFAKIAGHARGGPKASRSAPGELLRFYPLEDIRIISRAEGDGSGTLVEAYATVFDEPAEIHDFEGHYMEVIDRAAFDQVLARIQASRGGFASAVKVLYNHGKTMEGQPAPEYQIPLGTPVDIRPERRGLLTRTRYDADDPFAERILSKVKSGSITAQSFVGGIIRSSPELRGPGDRRRRRNGVLTTVRRMVLGLREYGPVLFPAYTGAEILGVRMQLPGDAGDPEPDLPEDETDSPDMEGDVTGGTPEDVTSTPRYHAHRLLALRTEEICREAGIGPLRSQW